MVAKLSNETRIIPEVLRKPRKASFITAGFPHETCSDNLPNKSQKCYHLSQIAQFGIRRVWADDSLTCCNEVEFEYTLDLVLNATELHVKGTDTQVLTRNVKGTDTQVLTRKVKGMDTQVLTRNVKGTDTGTNTKC